MASRTIRVLIGVAVLAFLAVAARYTLFRPETVPVTVFRASRGVVEQSVTNSKSGTVRVRRRATLSPEIGGRVAEIPVREGERVRSGQVLMRLADDDLQAQVVLAERSLAAARAAERQACLAAQQAEREHRRYLALAGERIVSPELLDRLESARDVSAATCDAAAARVAEAEAAGELAQVQRAKTVLRAPFDAVVAEISADLGEWITPSPPGVPIPPVVELIETSSVYIAAPLDEVDVARVTAGLPVRVTLDAYPERALTGRVSRVAPYVLDFEEHSRTVEIEVELDDREFAESLLPGTSADVEVILDARDDVLRVPSYALIEGRRVLVVNDGELVARDVETGLRNWAFTEVMAGLEEGTPVVVSLDRAEVTEGARARIVDETLE